MSLKDLSLWAEEARRNMLQRKVDAYDAALLPYQEPAKAQRQLDHLAVAMTELEAGAPMAAIEDENAALIAQRQEHAAMVLTNRKKRGARKRVRRPPSKARRIR